MITENIALDFAVDLSGDDFCLTLEYRSGGAKKKCGFLRKIIKEELTHLQVLGLLSYSSSCHFCFHRAAIDIEVSLKVEYAFLSKNLY